MRLRCLALGFGLSLLLGACSVHTNPPSSEIALTEFEFQRLDNLTYSPESWPQQLAADVYLPRSQGLRAAVLVVHGGGWERRSREDMVAISERLASRGFVAVNISYRFAPQYPFPAQLHDLQQAMHWIHRNAEKWRVDTQRIGALGYSAGAHLVSLMALVAGQGGVLDEEYGGAQTRPAAVVAGGTPSDLRKFKGGSLVPQFLGGPMSEIPGVYASASPVVHVHSKAPPFFIYHGANDLLVRRDHADDFAKVLSAQGVYTELLMLRLRGHITTFLSTREVMPKAIRFFAAQMDAESAS